MQTKPLRSLGLDVTAQTLDNLLKTNEAFKNLGVTSSKALLQSDKAMLRLIVVLQNAQNSFGDMQRTINTLSNQIKVFQGSLANLKLAIGDLFSEPFRRALVFINGFIIALTDIIRLFKKTNTSAATAGSGMEQFADETEDAVDASTGGGNLDFDEFRVLGDSNSQISITEAITEELQKQINAYNEQIKAMGEVKNDALEVAEAIKSWLVVTDDDGKFVSWTQNAENLFSSLQALVFILGGTVGRFAIFAKIIYDSYQNNEEFKNSVLELKDTALATLPQLLQSISQVIQAIIPAISQILPLIVEIGTALAKVVSYLNDVGLLDDAIYLIVAAYAAWKTFGVIKFIEQLIRGTNKLTVSTTFLAGAMGLVIGAGLFVAFKDIIDTSGTLGKVLATLVATLIAVAAGFAAVKIAQAGLGAPAVAAAIGIGLGAGIAAVYGATQVIQGFANGGITDANFIMTHENGVREWVGKQGNSTAVVNDTQMSTVMSQSVRDGVLEAMSYGTGGNENINITVEAKLDGQKIYESTRRIARKNGEKFAKV